MSNIPSDEQLVEMQKVFTKARIDNWLSFDLLTWRWWLLLFLFIAPAIIWCILVDKKRLREILLYGMLIITLISNVDALGAELSLWSYPYKLIPVLARLITLDFSAFTVIYMLIYQYTNTWKSYIVTSLVISTIISFIVMPVFVWIKLYVLLNWNYFYSWLVLMSIALLAKWLMVIILKREKREIEKET